MEAGAPTAKSILEKPLKLLTEEDISQLTREDCRNFLKEKGMRRPSWNKSQAIQQVLSLKALFEPGDDSGAGFLRKILVSQPRVTTTTEVGDCAQPFHIRDNTPRSAEFSGDSPPYVAEKDSYKTVSPRSPAETSGQMTIFYSGKVNVYDGVPPEKAQSIMHFAANNPTDFPENRNCGLNRIVPKPMSKEKMVELPQYGLEKANPSRDFDVEGQTNRKVSLQRYLEKRKDRRLYKTKKTPGVASSSLEMYLNHQQRMNIATYSPEYQTKRLNLSVDLNNDLNSEDI